MFIGSGPRTSYNLLCQNVVYKHCKNLQFRWLSFSPTPGRWAWWAARCSTTFRACRASALSSTWLHSASRGSLKRLIPFADLNRFCCFILKALIVYLGQSLLYFLAKNLFLLLGIEPGVPLMIISLDLSATQAQPSNWSVSLRSLNIMLPET